MVHQRCYEWQLTIRSTGRKARYAGFAPVTSSVSFMKPAIVALLSLLPIAAVAATANSWYTGFPKALESSPLKRELPNTHFFEIPLSQFASAEQLLLAQPFMRIQNGYFGSFPTCPASTVPYLVRAVFERTNTVFFVYLVGTKVLVLAGALGPPEPQHRSALVVCLSVQPTAVYTAAGGAL